MSRITFENYAARAQEDLSYTEMAGRHSFQAEDEKNIPGDVAAKLQLNADDLLLDIGCGTGNVLLPLSRLVKAATGLDHPAPLRVLQQRITNEPITLIEGNFLDLAISAGYTKILAYSVLHLLSDFDEALAFIDKALSLLTPSGAALIGDVPNADKRQRFLATERGQAFQAEWDRGAAEAREKVQLDLPADDKVVQFNDESIARLLSIYRTRGFEACALPQPENLPMCFSREDILIRRLAA